MAKRNRRCDPQKQAYWDGVLRQWQTSSKTAREYCRDAGVAESALYFWRRELARRSQTAAMPSEALPKKSLPAAAVPAPQSRRASRRRAASFLPVRVVRDVAVEASRAVDIVLPQGRTIRVRAGFDRQTLVDVLAVLEVQPC